MSEYTLVPDLADLHGEAPADTIISRALHKSASLSVTFFLFAAGQELSEHSASRPATLYFVAGRAQIKLGEDEHAVGPGAWVHMPAGLPHAIRAVTPVTMLLTLARE